MIGFDCFFSELAEFIVSNMGVNGFISPFFTLALQNLNEAALVIAFLDLPFTEDSHGFKANQGRGIEIKAASNMMIFLKEI